MTGRVKEVVAKKGCWRGLSEGIAGGGDQRSKRGGCLMGFRRELSEGVARGSCRRGLQKGLTGGGDGRR